MRLTYTIEFDVEREFGPNVKKDRGEPKRGPQGRMTIWPGDQVGDFEVQRLVAYQGKEGCEFAGCTRVGGRLREDGTWELGECRGWHCSLCDAPTSMLGHDCPRSGDVS